MNLLKNIREKGYTLHLFFLWVPSSNLAIARIKERVAEGGHNVPGEDVRRRFRRGISNFFEVYDSVFDNWMLFDNSEAKPVLIARKQGNVKDIFNEKLFCEVKNMAE